MRRQSVPTDGHHPTRRFFSQVSFSPPSFLAFFLILSLKWELIHSKNITRENSACLSITTGNHPRHEKKPRLCLFPRCPPQSAVTHPAALPHPPRGLLHTHPGQTQPTPDPTARHTAPSSDRSDLTYHLLELRNLVKNQEMGEECNRNIKCKIHTEQINRVSRVSRVR